MYEELQEQINQAWIDIADQKQRIEELEATHIEDMDQADMRIEELKAQLAEIAELPRLVPDLGDYGSILDMVPEQGFEPTAYLDADKVQAILNREKSE